MSEILQNSQRIKRTGLSLVEFQVALGIASVLILGVYMTTVIPMAAVTKQTLQDEQFAGDIDAALTNLGNLVSPGMAAGNRLFIIYNSGGTAVTDGTAGVKLYVPYSSPTNDVNIFAQNGALVATQGTQTTTVVAAGVTSVSFTAVLSGSPAVRTGAVFCSLSFLSKGGITYTYSTTVLPRNQ